MAELDNLFGGENKPAEPAATSKEDWQIKREQSRTQAYEMLAEATKEISDPEIRDKRKFVQCKKDCRTITQCGSHRFSCQQTAERLCLFLFIAGEQ